MCMTDEDLAHAVRAAVCGWASGDGMWLQYLEASGQLKGRLSPESIRELAKAFKFNRNIPSKHNAREAAEIVAKHLIPFHGKHLKKFHGKQFKNLDARAAAIEQAVDALFKELEKRGHKPRHRMFSGMTKLVWFVAPEGWTLFDSIAARGVRKKGNMRGFYRTLDALEFLRVSKKIQAHLNRTMFHAVRGERVLDKYLMLQGTRMDAPARAERDMAQSQACHDAMPKACRDALSNLIKVITADQACYLDICNLPPKPKRKRKKQNR